MKILVNIFSALLLFTANTTAHAEQMQELGTWKVHYSAFPSTFLSPEIAKQYKVQRSKYSGLINISILDASNLKALDVQLSGTAKNLLGVKKDLQFKRIKDGKAIYYLSELTYRTEDNYQFNIKISKGAQSQVLKFEHKFYVE